MHVFAFRLFLLLSVTLVGNTPMLHAQTSATMRIPLNRAELTQSSITLFQNALYRWTISGRGSIGQVVNTSTVVDARFFVSNLPFQGIQRPFMPLDANGAVAAPYCTAFIDTPAASPCLVYLATNALRSNRSQPAAQSSTFRLTNAVQMKQFAFVPDSAFDMYNPNNVYSAIVQGANLRAQAVFVDRLGFNSNMSYLDNTDALTMRIDRLSPELLLVARPSFAVTSQQPARILNDDQPEQPFRSTVLDFGSVRVGSAAQTRRIVLYNRGLEPLRVRLEAPDQSNTFTVSSPSGDVGTERFINQQGDSLVLLLTYQPRTIGSQTLEVKIFTNDPVLSGTTGQGFFSLRLLAAAVNGVLFVTGLQNDTLNFGTSVGTDDILKTKTFPSRPGTFGFSRASGSQSLITVTSVVQTQGSVFSFDPSNPFIKLPFDIETANFNSIMFFRPQRIGTYLDSITIRGTNLEDYTIYLRGRAELADAVIERAIAPIDNDTLDFGSLVTGSAISRSIVVRNIGNVPISIRSFLEASGNSNEFTVLQSTGSLSDSTGGIFTTNVRYDAQPQYLAGGKQAFLSVEVRNPATNIVIAQRRYVLIATRLPNILAPARTVINFDSVYIGSERRDTTLIRNTSATYSATLQSQRIDSLTSTASQAFFADMFNPAPIARQYGIGASRQAVLRFRPRQRGPDSADFRLFSTVDSTGGSESLSVRLRGLGVEQQFDVESATSDGMNNSQILPPFASFAPGGYRKFTVDIGCVRLGLPRTIRIAFRNKGNLPFTAWNQFRTLSGNGASDSSFFIVREFTKGTSIAVDAKDSSLTVIFTPRAVGDHVFTYTLFSDIKRAGRIPTAPDSVEQIIVEIKARGITPSVKIENAVDTVRFPVNPLGTGCSVNSTMAIIITNPAEVSCGTPLGYSARILETGSPFSMTVVAQGIIQAAASNTLNVTFSPQAVGVYTATLLITTDAPPQNNVIRIALSAEATGQPRVIVSSASVIAAPGKRITVPIFVKPSQNGNPKLNSQALGKVKVASFQLRYNASLLRYVDNGTNETASDGARIDTATRTSADFEKTLICTITARRDTLIAKETLINLYFDTYLGRDSTTKLRIDSVRFGDASASISCLRAQVESSVDGTFSLDSVCGLNAKVEAVVKGKFLLADIMPNPVGDNVRVSFNVPYPTFITLEIVDALGQIKATLAEPFPEGIAERDISTAHLAPGIYFCRMRAERFSDMRKIIILR